jgi:predicted MFS family arabinose efflux permease
MRQVLRDSRYWILSLCFTFALVAQISAFVHQTAFAVELGIDLMQAALLPGYIGLSSIGGRFFFGWLSDRLRDAKYAACLGFLFMAAGVARPPRGRRHEPHGRIRPALRLRLRVHCPPDAVSLADRFAASSSGHLWHADLFVAGIGGSGGAIASGMIYDRFGSYTAAWWMDLVLSWRRHSWWLPCSRPA